MSGHSKWATIKHKKAAADSKRGKVFTKIIKEITIAARLGGGDPDTNPRLRMAIQNAKGSNMPSDNIKRAIQKGTGELPGQVIEEIVYEGYGPGGVALYIEVMTDNKNRTVAEIRHILGKHNGNLGATNSVSWKFEKKGIIVIPKDQIDEEQLLEYALDAGAQDLKTEDESYEVYTDINELEYVKDTLIAKNLVVESSNMTMVPNTTVEVDVKHAEQLLKLMDKLEDHDDVQNVYSDFDIPDDVMEKLSAE
ncbi:YebC/PmpR family DNA-binding transcriptional regulator [bacterium]|nr:YebC/PmpR family DNA-binding transcriptional regulator [candidate division CSSED10-310 bacterium]